MLIYIFFILFSLLGQWVTEWSPAEGEASETNGGSCDDRVSDDQVTEENRGARGTPLISVSSL